MSTIRCDIVSAEKEIFHGNVSMVIATGEMGELGIAPRHAPLITRLLDNTTAGVAVAEASYKTTVIAEPRSNSLIVRAANGARLELVKSLLRSLDTPTLNGPNGDAGNIYVVYLKNADATKLATVLRAAMTGTPGSSTSAATPLMANASAMNSARSSGSSFMVKTAPFDMVRPPVFGYLPSIYLVSTLR